MVTKNVEPASPKRLERNSAFEILRIIAMLLVLGHHFAWYGGGMNIPFEQTNRYIAQFLFIGGALGVDIFFILSGYFLVEGKFRIKKYLKLEFAVLFYSIGTLAVAAAFLNGKYDIYTWLRAIFPIVLENYWFLSVYAVVYILSPLFNRVINSMDYKSFSVISLIMFFLVCVIPVVTFRFRSTLLLGNFLMGIYGYFIGAYIRKYPIKILDNKKASGVICIGTYVIMGVISVFGFKNES